MFGLNWQLKKLARRGNAPRTFKAELRSQLSTAYDARYGVQRTLSHGMRFAMVGMLSLVLMFGMGTGVYAYESPDVAEGHPLNVVKQGMEGIEGSLARTPEARAQFHAKMMRRRLLEAAHHVDDHPVMERALQRAADELDMSLGEFKSGLQDPATRQQIVNELKGSDLRNAPAFRRVIMERQSLREKVKLFLDEDLSP